MRYFLLTFLCELPFFDRINSAYDLTPDLYCPILPGQFKHKVMTKLLCNTSNGVNWSSSGQAIFSNFNFEIPQFAAP